MVKQFKAELINFKHEQSLREREITLKAKKYIESLAHQMALTDRTNMRHLLAESDDTNNDDDDGRAQTEKSTVNMQDLLHRVLRTSVEKQLRKHVDLRNEILGQSMSYTLYMIHCLRSELNEKESVHAQGRASLNHDLLLTVDSFSTSDLSLIVNDLSASENKNLTF